MTQQNLLSQHSFSTNALTRYTTSVALKKADHFRSSSSADDRHFSDLMTSLEKTNDTDAKTKPYARDRDNDASKNDVYKNDAKRSDKSKMDAAGSTADDVHKHRADTARSNSRGGGSENDNLSPSQEQGTFTDNSAAHSVAGEKVSVKGKSDIEVEGQQMQDNTLVITHGDMSLSGDISGLEAEFIGLSEGFSNIDDISADLLEALEHFLNGLGNAVSVDGADLSGVANLTQEQKNAFLSFLDALVQQAGEHRPATQYGAQGDALQDILARLRDNNAGDGTFDALFSALNPQELDLLKSTLNGYLGGELSAEELDDLAALSAEYAPQLSALLPNGVHLDAPVGRDIATVAAAGGENTNDLLLSSRSSADTAGAHDPKFGAQSAQTQDSLDLAGGTKARQGTSLDAEGQGFPLAGEGEDGFEVTLDDADQALGRAGKAKNDGADNHVPNLRGAQQSPGTPGAGQRFLQSIGAQQGLIAAGAEADALLAEQNASGLHGTAQIQSASTAGTGRVGSLQASNGAQAHPASQMISMTMQRALQRGEDTTIKLQLDPPELGRVEVKMSIDGDNMTHIVLTAEKPETHQMLQRDAQFLERAMSEAGLNADGNLSFELASDGQSFERDGSSAQARGRDAGNGAGGRDEGDSLSLASETARWQIDPHTGHMRYNILA
ncbi:MAG: flagellar hook-length control protein FliK [Alphaproteobacteria bacterium]